MSLAAGHKPVRQGGALRQFPPYRLIQINFVEGLVLSGDGCSGFRIQMQPQQCTLGREKKTLYHLNETSTHFKQINFIPSFCSLGMVEILYNIKLLHSPLHLCSGLKCMIKSSNREVIL